MESVCSGAFHGFGFQHAMQLSRALLRCLAPKQYVHAEAFSPLPGSVPVKQKRCTLNDVNVRAKLPVCTQEILVCTGLHWFALVCTGLHWFALVCTGLHWFALVCTGLHWFALVCTGLYWWSAHRMRQDDPKDQKFITLLRQTHTLPFALLPCAKSKDYQSSHPGLLYAVFQPIDHINSKILEDLAQAHRDRKQWQEHVGYTFRQPMPAAAATQQLAGLKRQFSEGADDRRMQNGFHLASKVDSSHDALQQLPEAMVRAYFKF
jgi:hypothetical protein